VTKKVTQTAVTRVFFSQIEVSKWHLNFESLHLNLEEK